MIPFWTAVPFTSLLLTIAILPVVAPHFWEAHWKNGIIVAVFSLPVFIWLIGHEPSALLHSLEEYFSFICLLGSLFVISGGISMTGDLRATPRVNTVFLAFGAVLANFIGTTGASMVLIRPFLRTKRPASSGLFYLYRQQLRRIIDPFGRPASFLGLSAGGAFLLDAQTLSVLDFHDRGPPFYFLSVGSTGLPSGDEEGSSNRQGKD